MEELFLEQLYSCCFIYILAFRTTITQERQDDQDEEILRLKGLNQGEHDVEAEADEIRQVVIHGKEQW